MYSRIEEYESNLRRKIAFTSKDAFVFFPLLHISLQQFMVASRKLKNKI